MDNIAFDEVELNELLVLVQDKLVKLREWRTTDPDNYTMAIESHAELEWKILKMLEG